MAKSKSNIFCPNCGANNKIEQNFCRFCGLGLKETAKSLVAQLSRDEDARQLKKLKLIKKLTDVASIGLIAVISAGFLFYIYAILAKMVFSGERIFFGLALIFITFQTVMAYLRRINRFRKNDKEAGFAAQNELEKDLEKDLEKKETAKLLEEKPFEPIPSVKGNSTELLFAENKTKKL